MPHDHQIFLRETLQNLLEDFDGLTAKGFDRIVIVIMLLFGEAVALEIEGKDSAEVLDFFCECGKAESRVASAMDAKENGSFIACSED